MAKPLDLKEIVTVQELAISKIAGYPPISSPSKMPVKVRIKFGSATT